MPIVERVQIDRGIIEVPASCLRCHAG